MYPISALLCLVLGPSLYELGTNLEIKPKYGKDGLLDPEITRLIEEEQKNKEKTHGTI